MTYGGAAPCTTTETSEALDARGESDIVFLPCRYFPGSSIKSRIPLTMSTPVENSPLRRSKIPHPKGVRPVPEAEFPLCPLPLILGRAPRTARSGQGRAGFARRSGP